MNVSLRQYHDLLASYLWPQRGHVTLLAVFILGNTGLLLVTPQILRSFIDTAQTGEAFTTLVTLALLFSGVALGQQVVSVLATYFSERVAWTATNALRSDLARHCLSLDMAFHHEHTPGEMIERVDGDVNTLGTFFSTFTIQIVGSCLLLVGILVLLFREEWRAGLAFTLFVLLSVSILLALRNISVPYWRARSEARANMFGFLEERLAGTEDIRAANAQPYVLRRFYELTRTWLSKEMRAGLAIGVFWNTNETIWAVGSAAALALGAYLFLDAAITLGTVYMLFHYATMLVQPISRLTQELENLQHASASILRLGELLRARSTIIDGAGVAFPAGAVAVEFDKVTFGYHREQAVLHDISFRLSPGRTLGLLGRTGSGKTSLTRLVCRLYDPHSGTIRLGGQDIRQSTLPDLRERIGMVTQNVQLFHGTVRDNLTLFDPDISDERLREVITELGLASWYAALPAGLDTMLAHDGGLSAGEAQLLAFARVFLRPAGLVILDEASSRLDRDTERLIERALDKLAADRTVIVIAHRLATVQRVDEIMILENGHILEHGDRRRLASDPRARFHGLLRTGLEEVLA